MSKWMSFFMLLGYFYFAGHCVQSIKTANSNRRRDTSTEISQSTRRLLFSAHFHTSRARQFADRNAQHDGFKYKIIAL